MHGYPFSFPTSGYMKPIGGHSRVLIPGVLAVHSVQFLRAFIELGGRTTAIKLNTPDEAILVFAPIPWGPEAKKFLQTFEPGKDITDINVKYVVAPDTEHHMGLKSWKDQFPKSQIIGPDSLIERKKAEGLTIDHAFTENLGGKFLTAETWPANGTLNIPREVTAEFDFVYLPAAVNKELVLLHKPTSTLLTGDLIFNLPAYEQYKDAKYGPTSGFSIITKYLTIDSWLVRKLIGSSLPFSDGVALNAIYNWNFQRLIPCHGDIMEGPEIREKFASMFRKYIKAKA